jgi:hypothetical protein
MVGTMLLLQMQHLHAVSNNGLTTNNSELLLLLNGKSYDDTKITFNLDQQDLPSNTRLDLLLCVSFKCIFFLNLLRVTVVIMCLL